MDLDKIDVRWIDAERAFRRFSVEKAQGVIKTMVLKRDPYFWAVITVTYGLY